MTQRMRKDRAMNDSHEKLPNKAQSNAQLPHERGTKYDPTDESHEKESNHMKKTYEECPQEVRR